MIPTTRIPRRLFSTIILKRNTNQAHDLVKYAFDFLKNGKPSDKVLERVKLIHMDSVFSGVAALALKRNSPSLFKNEAMSFKKRGGSGHYRPRLGYAKVIGSIEPIPADKAIVANIAALGELGSTATTCGYNPDIPAQRAGELENHNYYPVVIAVAHQNTEINGDKALRAMILLDEILGRLCEAFSLRNVGVDQVLFGGLASLITYGSMMGATADIIEQAMGVYCTHHVPSLTVRHGKEISDLSGAASAIAVESALSSLKRAMGGFHGPRDIFRDKHSLFNRSGYTEGQSPFDLVLGKDGNTFSIMNSQIKMGLYHQLAGSAIEGVLKLLKENKSIAEDKFANVQQVQILGSQQTFDILGGPDRANPVNRNAALQSMPYIKKEYVDLNELWIAFSLSPKDYTLDSLKNTVTADLMKKIVFKLGESEFNDKSFDSSPAIVKIEMKDGKEFSSELILYPAGHPKDTQSALKKILENKHQMLAQSTLSQPDFSKLKERLENFNELPNAELQLLYSGIIKYADYDQ